MRTFARIVLGTTLAVLLVAVLLSALIADWLENLRSTPHADSDPSRPQESLS